MIEQILAFFNDEDTKVNLKDLSLVKEDDNYYLSAVYTVENKSSVKEVEIPRVMLPVTKDRFVVTRENKTGEIFADIGLGKKYAAMSSGVAYLEKLVEEKVHEMTIEEVEKKLGHKVKIVPKKAGK